VNYLLEVCLLAATLATGITPWSVAQLSGAAPKNSRLDVSSENRSDGKSNGGVPQELERGISVELPATRNARPMPEADREDALIVTVTEDGGVYFGLNPVNPDTLAEEVKKSMSNRTDQKLYIKADARTRYANVRKVILAARTAGVRAPILLTSQPGSPKPNTLAAPTGFEVLIVPPFTAGSEPAAVELLGGRALAVRPRRRGE
jgi:biopolymer transport protein ExbD